MPRIVLLALLLTGGTPLWAVEVHDYAYQAILGESQSKLQRIELPLEVMLQTASANVGDVAVFNADGKALPHTVLRTRDRYAERVIELPFHRFDRFLQRRHKTVTRREQQQQENSVAETQTTETIAVQSVRSDYLVELEPDGEQRQFESLELEWQHEPASQLLGVRVEAGNEIDRLRTIRPRKSLSNNQSGDPDWRRIRKIPSRNRYLRLIPLDGVTRFELERVEGRYLEKIPAPMLTLVLEPELISENGVDYYYFRFPSVHAVQSMSFVPAEDPGMLSGDLYFASRSEPESRQLAQRGYRQHNLAGDEIKPSRPFNMTRQYPYAAWFTTDTRQAAAPRVELTYAQHEVVFLADGNGPYRLAWGNIVNPASVADLGEMLAIDLTDPAQRGAAVSLGPIEQAGGPERLQPRKVLPWKKWLLWALLILAALITGRMALGLYREMNAKQT